MNIEDKLKEIEDIASYINNDARSVRFAATELAEVFMDKLSSPIKYAIDDMDQRYTRIKEMYFLNDTSSEEGFKQIASTGALKLNNEIKQKLLLIEELYPKISETYRRFKYVDEVWYLDKQSVVGGNTHINVIPRVQPGFDIGGEYERGERPYSRFGIIGSEQNPERKSLWSPDALIELFDEFVISAQTPVYVKNELMGKISIHYNLIFLRQDTIAKSNNNLMIITNNNTLVGLSPGAKEITNFIEYDKREWNSKKAKMEFVASELNLVKQNESFTEKLKLLKNEESFEFEFSGKKFQVFKKDIPEIGFMIISLI